MLGERDWVESGIAEYERDKPPPPTVLKGPTTTQVKLYLVRYILQDCQPPVGPYARITLRFETFKIEYFGAFGLKILSK